MNTPSDKFAHFRALLTAQRKQLLAELGEKIAAANEGLADRSMLADDDALTKKAVEVELAMAIHESEELKDIEAALARIDEGSYGSCEDCGNEIARARLLAYPTAKRCLGCQEEHERSGGGHSGVRH